MSDFVPLMRDVLARVVRTSEALRDGELDLAATMLDDLASDLWAAIEAGEGKKA
jgi:hypothetical protein